MVLSWILDKSWLMLIDAGDSKMWPMTREYSRQVAKAKSISGPKTRKSTHRRASLSALLFCCHICIIVTRLCNFHCHCIALDCHIQLVLGWYHHQPESHQLSLHKCLPTWFYPGNFFLWANFEEWAFYGKKAVFSFFSRPDRKKFKWPPIGQYWSLMTCP